ncbi:MAG: bifunctional [glutamate--ammonia ligase]-adenylyl-L-tyrosine phosphorylase/[glutamate--ammonia-ligase] adenylyltransferase [Verrucomicrobiota bacterium]
MKKVIWKEAIKTCADPPRVQHYLDQLKTTGAAAILKSASAEQARILTALLSGSQTLSEMLITHPDWLSTLNPESLEYPRQEQGIRREVDGWFKPLLQARDVAGAFARLREFKQREMLRIAARDLARLGKIMEITREISNVADVCLDSVYHICLQQLSERFGQPYYQDANERWQPTGFCVFGLGKLGGQELNYSSDVDVIFIYSEEGHVFKEPPRKSQQAGKGLTNHQFFKRLAEAFIAEVSRLAPEGVLYRIDLRLRPEGDAGPLTRSLTGYENYYAQWGQTWERMMLIKARPVAGEAALASEFLEMIQPFRYPRSLSERTLGEIGAMKRRIETEVVKAGEMDRNVKLGRGGIREIEFIAQSLQLLNAGRIPFLQGAQTLSALQKLAQYHLLLDSEAEALTEAYSFLRDVEHRLQMESNLQTHTIPTERKARERLALLMDFGSLADFEAARQGRTRNVRQIYDKLLKVETPSPSNALPAQFAGAEEEWKKFLGQYSFRDLDQSLRLVTEFVEGPGYVHVSPRTSELARSLLPRFLELCPKTGGESTVQDQAKPVLSDPDRVLARLDSFISVYGARALLYETWSSNPSLFDLLLWLFDRSEFLAEMAIRTPDLVDELELSGRLRRQRNAEEILKGLRHGREDDDQRLWLRRYHQAELMRIGLRDILGLADFEQNLIELSALAEACLQYALEVVLRKHKLSKPPIVIIGLGKLGGAELNYGSDLDVMFVAEPGAKNLPRLQRLAVEVMDLLSSQTELGIAFVTDARLRPDGEKGLLVNSLDAYEEYYRRRAMLWEIQSLTRTRPIAGDPQLGREFQELAARLTNFREPSLPLVAYTPAWRGEIARMRTRIEKERTPTGKESLAIKTGAGGLMDAEFIAQTLGLANGWQEANTLKALERARDARVLPNDDAESLIENYRKLRRIEGILRRWSFEGETLLPDNPAPLYRVAIRCGFRTVEAFMRALEDYRKAIRSICRKVFEA